MKKFCLIISLIFFVTAQNSSAAGNNLQTINTLSALEGDAFAANTHKESFNSFAEYPLSQRAAIGGSLQLNHTTSNHNGGTSAYALNGVEVFHRYKFLSFKHLAVSVHNGYKHAGLYNENKYRAMMPKQDDYELRFLFAHNMPDRLINTVVYNTTPYFLRAEIGFRKKFSNPFNEYRFILWSGFKINEKFSFLLHDQVTWNTRAKATPSDNSQTNLSNFSMSKHANHIATFSLMYHYNHDVALQFGYLKRFSGNNPFYDDRGLVFGLWNSF